MERAGLGLWDAVTSWPVGAWIATSPSLAATSPDRSRAAHARSVDAYVRRILVNTYLDWTRRRSWAEQPVSDELIFGNISQADDAGTAVMRAEQLHELLTSIAPQARTIIVLRYYLDLDDATIAEYLSIAPSTVRSTASRALATLRTVPKLLAMKEPR